MSGSNVIRLDRPLEEGHIDIVLVPVRGKPGRFEQWMRLYLDGAEYGKVRLGLQDYSREQAIEAMANTAHMIEGFAALPLR